MATPLPLGEGWGEGASPDHYLSSYTYDLPAELIAQTPTDPRDSARLLVLDRATGAPSHRTIRDLPDLLGPGDLLVANRSRVLPGRLVGRKANSGGRVELLLLRERDHTTWEAIVGGHRIRPRQRVEIANEASLQIGEPIDAGWLVHFPNGVSAHELMQRHGQMPLPPYIHGYGGDPDRYQTVYADVAGSAAAPTAGLHFTPELIARLRDRGVEWTTLLLHVGLDTFKPIVVEDVRRHRIHSEWVEVPGPVVDAVGRTRARGGRVVAVGTTTVRALEHAAASGTLQRYTSPADTFIYPGYQFRVIDALLTNFHLPGSSLLLLVSAFAGRERVLAAYEEAIRQRYRFYSFGDAMLIW